MNRGRLTGFILMVLAILVVLFALLVGLVTSLRDLATQIVASTFILLGGAGVSLLLGDWIRSMRRRDAEHVAPPLSAPVLPAPDLKIVEPRYRGGGFHGKIQDSWSWVLKVRNDGQRDGEIRSFRVGIVEIDPPNLGLSLELQSLTGGVEGIRPKEYAQLVTISIRYAGQNPTSYLTHEKVTKLVAELSWDKETLNGFIKDSLRLTLIPEPPRA
jgi:hypothetical protein